MDVDQDMDVIKGLLKDKSVVKQDVFSETKAVFDELKTVLSDVSTELKRFANETDDRIEVATNSDGAYDVQITLAGDMVVFHMHTNVFTFPLEHRVSKSPYIQKNPANGYFGIINIYNFLSDSFRFQRLNDMGYLVGRIFVNRERHFFVEGKQQLGFRFNDFSSGVLDGNQLRNIVETTLSHVIQFELYAPPYRSVSQVSLEDMLALNHSSRLQTAKRLGFRFDPDDESTPQF